MCPHKHRGKASKNATFESVTGMLLDSLGIFFFRCDERFSEKKIARLHWEYFTYFYDVAWVDFVSV